MPASEILEALMLGSFSIGWYWSIFAMIWTRRPYGKNAAFVACTVAGYGFGLTAKLIMWNAGATFNYLIILYSWNLLMTVFDLWLFVRLSRRVALFPDNYNSTVQPGSQRPPIAHGDDPQAYFQ